MRKSRWILLAAGAAAWAGCARSLPPVPAPPPQLVLWDRAWTYQSSSGQNIRTPHYDVYTTHSNPVFLERLPQFMETAFAHYQQLIRPTRRPTGLMEVYLFGQRDQWERFTDEATGPAAASIYRKIQEGGYVDNGRAVFYDIQPLKTFAVTGHECFHQYIWHYTAYRPPAWLDEGLACYFEGFFWQGRSLRFEPRRNLLRLQALGFALTQKALLDLNELLSGHPGQVIGGPSSRVASYYAQLWALVLFLQDDARYKGRFAELLADVGSRKMLEAAARAGYTGKPGDYGPAVFRAYIRADVHSFEGEFRSHCLKLADL